MLGISSGRRSGEPRGHLFLCTVVEIHRVEFPVSVSYIASRIRKTCRTIFASAIGGRPQVHWRAGRTAIAPVLKTGARKGLGVRIPRSPLECPPATSTFCIPQNSIGHTPGKPAMWSREFAAITREWFHRQDHIDRGGWYTPKNFRAVARR